jgi:hypothetical protein
MTNFEKSIKREMTQKKYDAIREHVYGDGKNTFDYIYGAVSSWFIWNRDKNNNLASAIPPDHRFVGGRWKSIYDGSIENWSDWLASKITTDIVFLGLNMSGDGKMELDLNGKRIPYFQNARGHGKIVDTFFNTKAEGAYFTDIIKPDKRILENVENPSKGDLVKKFIAKTELGRKCLKDHIQIFKEELEYIGAVKPLLIVFEDLKHEKEGDISWILKQEGLSSKFLAIVKIMHYSSFPKGSFYEGFKNDTRQKLKDFITIP